MKTFLNQARRELFAPAAIASAVLAVLGAADPALAASAPTAYTFNGEDYNLSTVDTANSTALYIKASGGAMLLVAFSDDYGTVSSETELSLTEGNALISRSASAMGLISSNVVSGDGATAVGGLYNMSTGQRSTTMGGHSNTASGAQAVVVSGSYNTASGLVSLAAGGYNNVASGQNALVLGGKENTASYDAATTVGGDLNTATGSNSLVAGGQKNTAAGFDSTAVGGRNSLVLGFYSTGIAGGSTGKDAQSALAAGFGSVATVALGTAIGYRATADEANTVSFGHDVGDVSGYTDNGDGTWAETTYTDSVYNRLVKVGYGTEGHDAATVAQLPEVALGTSEKNLRLTKTQNADSVTGKNLYTLSLSSTLSGIASIENGSAKVSLSSSDGSVSVNGVRVTSSGKVTNVTAATIASSSKEAVNGGQLYGEIHVADGTYNAIASTNTVAENLIAIDAKLSSAAGVTYSQTTHRLHDTASDADIDELAIENSVSVGSIADGNGFAAVKDYGVSALYGETSFIVTDGKFAGGTEDAGVWIEKDEDTGKNTASLYADGSGFMTAEGISQIAGGDTVVTVSDDGVDVGGAKLTNVAAGTANTDGVNVSQLKAAFAEATAAHTTVEAGDTNITVASETDEDTGAMNYKVSLAKTIALDSVTAGGTTVINANGISVGGDAGSSLTSSALKIAGNTYITGNGIDANKQKITNVADGKVAEGSSDAVNGGQLYAVEAKVDGLATGKIEFKDSEGNSVKAGLGEAVTIEGADANITTAAANGKIQVKLSDSLNIAESVKVGGENGVLLDKDGVKYDGKTYIGKDGLNANNEKISNVADGSVTKGSKDAVNGGQLWETNQKLDKVAETAGNAVTWDKDTGEFTDGKTGNVIEKVKIANTTISADGINNGGQKITNIADGTAVGDAVNYGQLQDAVKNSVTAVEGDGKYIETSFTQTDAGKTYTVSFTESSKKAIENANKYLTSDGINASSQKITNVAAGELSATSADAVNGSQLFATNQQVEANAGSITKLWKKTGDLNKKINRAGANAAALAALHPLDYDEDHKVSASAGIGQYHGTGALAVGVSIRPTENLMLNLGGSFTSDDRMMNAGLSYRFGDDGSAKYISKADMVTRVNALTAENRDLTAQLTSTSAKLEAASGRLEATNAKLEDANAGLRAANAKIEALTAEIEAIKAMLRK